MSGNDIVRLSNDIRALENLKQCLRLLESQLVKEATDGSRPKSPEVNSFLCKIYESVKTDSTLRIIEIDGILAETREKIMLEEWLKAGVYVNRE